MAEKKKTTLKVIVARVIVGVLFSMLIVSFAVWGIGPIFRQGGRFQPVAEIGPLRISPQEFQDQYRREVNRLQNVLQTSLDPQRARELGIPQRVVQDMVGRALFDLAARDAGVAVSDGVIRQSIVDNPNFRDAQGQFDRNLFERLLFNAGYSEERFVAVARQDLARAQVTDALTAGVAAPQALIDALYRYRNERRVAETLTVSASSITSIPTPTDADLDAYHKGHADLYTAPEYRAVTAVLIQPQELADGMKVPDEKVKEEYDARIAEFRVPEQRTLRQIVVADEATAKRAQDMLAKGNSFDAVAKAVTGKAPSELGTVKHGDIGNDQIESAAFELKENANSAPIQDPLGWHIIQVAKIAPGRTQNFDEVKDKLRHDIAMREAGDAVFDIGNKLQDALGGGATLEEAAKKLNLKLAKFDAIDDKGAGPDGKPVAGLPQVPKFVSTAFSSDTGRESDLIEDGHGGYVVLRVDKVTPRGLRPLAAVRDKVTADWQAEQRGKAAEKLVASLLDKAKGGASLADLAKAGGYTLDTTKPFTRTGQGAETPLPPALVAALFMGKIGDLATAPALQGAMIARLTTITPADPSANKQGFDQLRDQTLGSLSADLLNEFANELRSQYGVEINSEVIDSLTGS